MVYLNYSVLMPCVGHSTPLKERIIKEESISEALKAPQKSRPVKYKQWSEVSMREAINAVNLQGMSVAKAAVLHGIPRTTLSDHKLGYVLPGSKPGRPTLLSSSEEQDLVDFLLHSAAIGYARTRNDVILMVERMMLKRGEQRELSGGWWNSFVKRHPEVGLRTPATLSISRARASSRDVIDSYFNVLEEILKGAGLTDSPSLIFNMDETGFPLDPKPAKTIHRRGETNPYTVSSGSKAQVTVVACVSATGQTIPPFVIWKRKTMSLDLAFGELPGSRYGFSENGWMQGKLFNSWFRKQFIPHAPAGRPLILLLDGHSSHLNPDTIRFAAENGVIIFALPPNTTHLTQPLDKGVFGPFKCHWKQVCHNYMISHPGQVVNEYNFVSLLSKAWLESMTAVNIIAGFQTTGIYPLDPDVIVLPGESRTEGIIAPKPIYTPFKRFPAEDGVYASEDLKDGVKFASKTNSLATVTDMRTPGRRPQRVKPPSDMVLTSAECLQKLEERKKGRTASSRRKSKASTCKLP